MTKRLLRAAATAAGLALAAPLAADAQEARRDARAIGAWLVACVDGGAPTARCEMAQRVVDEAGAVQILSASILAARDAPPSQLTFTTPLGVWLEPGALLVLPAGARPLAYERCAPNGCAIPVPLDEELRAALEAGGRAELRFADRLKRPLAAPVSLDGFDDALAEITAQTSPTPPRRGLANWFRRLGR